MERRKSLFISYRRSDSAAFAGRIFDTLNTAFPACVFMDTEIIRPGEDFVSAIEATISACKVVVVLIGPRWLTFLQQKAEQHHTDHVALELEAAFKQGKQVIPVLVDGATMPSMDDLPPASQALSRLNATEIRHTRFERDMHDLIKTLSFMIGRRPVDDQKSSKWREFAPWIVVSVTFYAISAWPEKDPVYWYGFWIYVYNFVVIPLITVLLSFTWPIGYPFAVGFVITNYLAVNFLPIPIFLDEATRELRQISIGFEILGVILFIGVAIANCLVVGLLCSHLHHRLRERPP